MSNDFKKIILIIFLLLIIFAFGFWSFNYYQKYFLGVSESELNTNSFTNPLIKDSVIKELLNIETPNQKELQLPGPLVLPTTTKGKGYLDSKKILSWTNFYREKEDIASLTENETLNQAAQKKLEDMFQRQYFEHVSPDGKNAGDIVSGLGYQYLRVGENLAMGNFKDEKDLVDAWIASPGHRENILNSKFTEIGVAAKSGTFQGNETFLSVQVFASPLSDCPIPDESLKSNIEEKEKTLQNFKNEADSLKKEIETLQKNQETLYNQEQDLLKAGQYGEIDNINNQLQEGQKTIQNKIDAYNKLVPIINTLSQELQNLIFNYNQQVNEFNQCLQM